MKSSLENFKLIRNTSPNKSGNPESLKKIIMIVEKLSTITVGENLLILQVVLFTILCFKRSAKEHLVSKILLAICVTFLYENSFNSNSLKFSYKLAFILFFSFIRTKNKCHLFRKLVIW